MLFLPSTGNYIDIDAYASILAYADLLNQTHRPAKTFISVAPNYSVPDFLRQKNLENPDFDFARNFTPDDAAIILDVSHPDAIARVVSENQIAELIDHHPGYEHYWHERLGERATIEKIGAVATIIFEKFITENITLSPEIAQLLLAAILDNTLNFNAAITTARDKTAAENLAKILEMPLADFTQKYFREVSATVISDLEKSLVKDCKIINFPPDNSDLHFAQITLWDAHKIANRQAEIAHIMNGEAGNWLVSVLDIAERKNFLLAGSVEIADYFTNLLKLHHENHWLVSDQLYLRKEIMAKME